MGETYYEILDVDTDATPEEITTAYRERVLETHPDRNDDPDATEQFKRVTSAEAVLGDETERARYDRLGHRSYCRLRDGWSSTPDDSPEPSTDSSDGTAATDSSDGAWSRAATGSRSASDPDGGPSHHARHRERRERATWAGSRTQRASWFEADVDGGGEREPAGDGGTTSTDGGFRYAVHQWDDEVDVGSPFRPLERSALVLVCCVALVYPVLVYASVTPQFWLPVNVVVAGCTLVLVGYLLTMPRAASAAFGSWSLLVPLALPRVTTLEPLSFVGLLAIAAFWVPFGFALGLWAAMRR
ncbi:J domain-containing protein [Natronobiforma cellulositropha]|uniref:J domain-containing protein n=1 Tax=Natronobiforma cellulositropha TaxID=1679076 RepID=UPI0021D571F3|nr:DnaJ domain-containing protein [Natronobiforma cellulositropha]